MSRQISKKDIWRLQKDTWKLNDNMECKILHFAVINYATLFIQKKSVCTSPCLSPFPTSLSQTSSPSAILKQQQVEKITKKYYAFGPLDTSCDMDTGIIVFLAERGFPKFLDLKIS